MKYSLFGLFIVACLLSSPAIGAEPVGKTEFGTFTGQIRYYYFTQRDKDKDTKEETIKESLSIGGYLKYETPWLGDMLQVGAAGFTSQPFPSEFNKKDKGGTLNLDGDNQGVTVLGEAYVTARFDMVESTLYRQRIDSPMVNSSDSRMIPNTFEAYTVSSRDLDDFQVEFGWVDRIKQRDSDKFKYMSEVSGNADLGDSKRGMWVVGGDWAPEGYNNRAWVYVIPDYMQMVYIQGNGKHALGEDMAFHWLVQGLDQRSVGGSDGGSFNVAEIGLLGGLTVSGVAMEIGGTIVDNTTDVVSKWGSYPFFNDMMSFGNNRAGERALFLSLSYDFSRINWDGFSSSIKTSWGDTPDSGRNASNDRDEYNLNLNYAFDGDLKGLSILNRLSYQNTHGDKDGYQVRLRLQYNF